MLRSEASRLAVRNFLSGLVVGSLGGGLSYWALTPSAAPQAHTEHTDQPHSKHVEVDANEEKKFGEISHTASSNQPCH